MGFQDPDSSNQRESPAAQHTSGLQSPNIQDAGQSNQTDLLNLSPRANSLQVMPEIEVLRDAKNDSNHENPPVFPDLGDDNTAPNENFDQNMNEKDHNPPMIDDLDVGGLSASSQQHSGSPTLGASQGAPEAQVFLGECIFSCLCLLMDPNILIIFFFFIMFQGMVLLIWCFVQAHKFSSHRGEEGRENSSLILQQF